MLFRGSADAIVYGIVVELLVCDMQRFVWNMLQYELRPKGVAVILEAEHMCMNMRGAKAAGSTTQTSALRGIMKTDARTRAEALALLTK